MEQSEPGSARLRGAGALDQFSHELCGIGPGEIGGFVEARDQANRGEAASKLRASGSSRGEPPLELIDE